MLSKVIQMKQRNKIIMTNYSYWITLSFVVLLTVNLLCITDLSSVWNAKTENRANSSVALSVHFQHGFDAFIARRMAPAQLADSSVVPIYSIHHHSQNAVSGEFTLHV